MILVFSLMLSLSPDLFQVDAHTPEVQKWRTFLLVERENQTRMALTNASTYVPQIAPLFRERGVPEDMVWIGLIESSFRPSACSPSNACGMFQFKTGTARAFGLKVNKRVDERMNPARSAEASAEYLAYLGKKFKDWDLALAAYNLGEGDLYRTMKKHKALTWPEVQPFVRKETQNYVAKIRAAAQIGRQHMAMFSEGDTDHLNKGVNLQDVFGVYPDTSSFEAITALAAPTVSLNEPKDNRQEIAQAAQENRLHRVQKGDNLYSLSRKYRVNLQKLRQVNGLKNNHLDIGQNLIIP